MKLPESVVSVTVCLPRDHAAAVERIAAEMGIDRSAVIERAVRVYQLAIWQAQSHANQILEGL